ncbi:Gram-negative bacterial tonB protein [compost metagenome]
MNLDIFIDPMEVQPVFPGGEEKMHRYISSKMEYPTLALKNRIQGKVIVSFYIDTLGALSDIKALRGIGYGCDEEAIRIVKSMPKWAPATRNNKPVKVNYHLPISFNLKPQ